MENALAIVTGEPWPSVIVTFCADAFVLVMMMAITHDVVDVSAVELVGTACHAGVNAVVPQDVLGTVCTWPITFAPAGSEPVTLNPVLEIDPVTVNGVMEAMPCTVMTSADAVPAVPIAGCLAAVAAPVGSETVPAMLFTFQVPPWFAVTTLPGPPYCCNCAYSGPSTPAAAHSRRSPVVM